MKIYRVLEELPRRPPPSAVTIGNFDGVHRGHLKVIERLLAKADRLDAIPTAVTFDPHPQKLFRGEAPPALMTLEKRIALLEEGGIKRLLILEFDRALSLVEPEEFIERVLVGKLNTKAVVVGSVFRFGHKARGDNTMLRTFGRRLGFEAEGVRIARLGGRSVSSTEIRHAIARGDVEWAARALGRPYALVGRIVKGKARGKELGFPTANLEPVEGLCIPGMGVYAGRAVFGRTSSPAALSVGTNPTFGKGPISTEAHILGFAGDIYGAEAEFQFIRFLREQKTFDSPDALSSQMSSDVEATRRIVK